MTPGRPLGPTGFVPIPDNRVEARYKLTLGPQARCLQRDRVFNEPYMLLGADETPRVRRVMESCGLGLPARVLGGGGLLGEFPGIDRDPGAEVPERDWGRLGVQHGRRVGGPIGSGD